MKILYMFIYISVLNSFISVSRRRNAQFHVTHIKPYASMFEAFSDGEKHLIKYCYFANLAEVFT